MIDDENKFIFVENPKAASETIKDALMGENKYNPSDPRIATVNHAIPAVIKSKYPDKWESYLSFVVVRNTWGKARSFFEFYRNIALSDSYLAIDFDQWVEQGCPRPGEQHLNTRMHSEGIYDDVICQLRYAEGVDEVIVLHSFDQQARSEELQNGFSRVCQRIGMLEPCIPTSGNHHARSRKAPVWKRETVERLGKRYQKEVEYFDFKPPTQLID